MVKELKIKESTIMLSNCLMINEDNAHMDETLYKFLRNKAMDKTVVLDESNDSEYLVEQIDIDVYRISWKGWLGFKASRIVNIDRNTFMSFMELRPSKLIDIATFNNFAKKFSMSILT